MQCSCGNHETWTAFSVHRMTVGTERWENYLQGDSFSVFLGETVVRAYQEYVNLRQTSAAGENCRHPQLIQEWDHATDKDDNHNPIKCWWFSTHQLTHGKVCTAFHKILGITTSYITSPKSENIVSGSEKTKKFVNFLNFFYSHAPKIIQQWTDIECTLKTYTYSDSSILEALCHIV